MNEPLNAPNDGNSISPLPGEPGIPDVAARVRGKLSAKGLLAVALLIVSLAAVLAFTIQRFTSSGKKADEVDAKRAGDRPTAATTEPRKLDMQAAPAAANGVTAGQARIPALVPTAEETAEPIGVRRTGQGTAAAGAKSVAPEDAPVLLVSRRPGAVISPNTQAAEVEPDPNDPVAVTQRNLQGYQRQLQGLMASLTKSTAAVTGQGSSVPPLGAATPAPATAGGGLFGGQLQSSATPRVTAAMLGDRSLTLPKGTAFTCALKTRVVSAASGFVGCQVQRHVYSDDGRVLLIERGSHMDGEYRITSVRPGMVRIPVLWTRIRTPHGVTVDVESPGTGQLGESGIDGHVDNRWVERIGAAMLLSLIDDSVKLLIQNQTNDTQASTVVLPSTTANSSKLAEKVLDSTVNIPPLIYQNQGGIVGIYVARDVDFSAVYELKAVSR